MHRAAHKFVGRLFLAPIVCRGARKIKLSLRGTSDNVAEGVWCSCFVLLTSLNLLSLGIASSKLMLCAHLLAALFFCLKLIISRNLYFRCFDFAQHDNLATRTLSPSACSHSPLQAKGESLDSKAPPLAGEGTVSEGRRGVDKKNAKQNCPSWERGATRGSVACDDGSFSSPKECRQAQRRGGSFRNPML